MTVEQYVARALGVPARSVSAVKFHATPGRVWSEYTEESFDCHVSCLVDGEEKHLWWGEADVCEFLNEMWDGRATEGGAP